MFRAARARQRVNKRLVVSVWSDMTIPQTDEATPRKPLRRRPGADIVLQSSAMIVPLVATPRILHGSIERDIRILEFAFERVPFNPSGVSSLGQMCRHN